MAKQDFKPTQMTKRGRGRRRLCAVANAVVLAVLTAMTAAANAQGTGPQITTGAAQPVDLKTAPEVPSVRPPAGLVTNRPTIPMADYLAAKRAAALRAGQPKPAPRR
jgi:hypothetical protein